MAAFSIGYSGYPDTGGWIVRQNSTLPVRLRGVREENLCKYFTLIFWCVVWRCYWNFDLSGRCADEDSRWKVKNLEALRSNFKNLIAITRKVRKLSVFQRCLSKNPAMPEKSGIAGSGLTRFRNSLWFQYQRYEAGHAGWAGLRLWPWGQKVL